MSELVQINPPSAGPNMEHNEEEANKFELVVRLCQDVLLEALLLGDRRRLTKLERIGHRLHRIIENFFQQRPFLCLGLKIDSRHGTRIIGLGRGETSLAKLTMLPTFLRFDNVQLLYDTNNTKPIEEKCEFIKSQLLPIKLALNGSNMVNFHACIRQENCHFNDHSQLLECIRNRFLPICNSFRGYTFEINFLSDPNTNTTVIASLLKMDELKRCSNILIKLRASVIQSRLPVEEISNWLEKSADGMENIRKNQNERFISIVSVCRLQYCLHALLRKVHAQSLEDGCQEMIDHLKKKFVEAKCSVQPFTFCFWHCDAKALKIEAQSFINKKTGEELSVAVFGDGAVQIKRALSSGKELIRRQEKKLRIS